jgi:hypothetical protein
MRVPFPTLHCQLRSDFGIAARIGTSYPSAPPKVVNGEDLVRKALYCGSYPPPGLARGPEIAR